MGSCLLLSAAARRLEGKVALITGGASGIGKCTARLFRQHGAKVVIADIQDELGHLVCDDLDPTDTTFIHCDVTNEENVKKAVDTAVSKYGKLDIMFNNAGIVDRFNKNIVGNEQADFKKVLDTNVTGVFLGMKHAARVMVPSRQGSIISTASVASVVGGAATHAYTCSKHAVVGLTKNVAVELGQFGIRVNSLSPFALETPLTKNFLGIEDEAFETFGAVHGVLKERVLKVEDVAQAALYLGSDESKYVSGHNLLIDGAYTIANLSLTVY